MTTVTAEPGPCTQEQAAQWSDQFGEGYRVGRGDARWNAAPRIPLIEVPAEIPGETGSRYVTRYVHLAFAIGYTRAYRYQLKG
jgi:hypothetical protein